MTAPFHSVLTTPALHPKHHRISADAGLSEKKPGVVERHVRWLNRGSGISYVGKRILAWMERLTCDLTVLLIPFVKGAVSKARKYRGEMLAQEFRARTRALPPPPLHRIEVESDTAAMNHYAQYVIHNGVIWFKPIVPQVIHDKRDESWQPIYFPPGCVPVKISVDGANLCVEDQNHEVHYRKVLREGCRENDPSLKGTYLFRDKSHRNNFKRYWFTLPVISTLMRLFTGKRLQLDTEKTRCWEISHRGQYNHFIEDAVGQQHTVGTGVTTLYVLENNGKDIAMFDPWKPEYVRVTIRTPETTTSSFEAEKMKVAASHLMTVGYETSVDEAGDK